jgi:HD-GYP domain-containing protein (c-di-GMP phosphodiesterase class II)
MSHAHHHDDPPAAPGPQGAGGGSPADPGAGDAAPDPQLRALSSMAFRSLVAAITQRRIYPPQHPTASRALASLVLYLERVLALVPEWRLAVVGTRLLAGGGAIEERPEALAGFLEDLKARGVDTLVFRRGVGAEELRRFLSLMILDPRAFAGTPLPERIAAEGIQGIEAGRLVLEAPPGPQDAGAAADQVGKEAGEVYENAISFIQDTILGFREGRRISMKEAEAFVQSMIAQIQEERSVYLILTTLKSHHPYTFTHIINVCILTLAQVEALGADTRMLRDFGLAAMMHDIGKSLVPREILGKPGRLTPEEFALIQRHPQDGVHILGETPGVPDLAMVVAFEHHMRYNRAGYPRLKHTRPLHPCSLMTNLADTYDAMRSHRAYQKESPPEQVAALITDRAGHDFDPHLARAFMQIMGAYPPGTRVRLDSGEEALVVRVNPANPYRPTVRILRDSRGEAVQRLEVVDLTEKEAIGGRFARSIIASLVGP